MAAQMKETMGPAYRDYDARVLARRRAVGVPAEAISVGSAAGRLRQASDGGWIAVAPAGTCAMLLLVSEREELVRDAATLVMNDA